MSAVYDYNIENNNFAPQGYYGRPEPHGYSTRNHPAASSHRSAAPAAFSFHHHNNHHHQAPSAPHQTAAAADNAVPVLAERYKTKYCKNYVQYGNCPYEERCMFAHGDEELRSVDDNVRDGLISDEAIKSYQRQWRQAIYQEQHYHHHQHQQEYVDEDAASTATVPKLMHFHQEDVMSPATEMPVKEYLAPGVFRFNPYGTLAIVEPQQQHKGLGDSRSSSVDNFSSIAGDDEHEDGCWMEETTSSTPQKRPLMVL